MKPSRPVTQVAVGVLVRPDGMVLLADRPVGKPYAGYWEFPGGKLEPGESVAGALARELHEELGVAIGPACPWVTFEFDYPHAYVRLHFCRVFDWQGALQAREGQRLDFFDPAGPLPQPLLPAALPALRWLALPPRYALTAIARVGPEAFLLRLETALHRGLRLVQLREPELTDDEVERLLPEVRARVHAYGGRLLVSSRHSHALWQAADGVHLTGAALAAAGQRPDVAWVGASVHSRAEVEQAAHLGCDFALAGAVLPTDSHPGRPALGWREFEKIAAGAPLPVYAIGGLSSFDLEAARRAGAHGVAVLSTAWPAD
jgi:8-oxo-dGTP diphosphatase